MSSKLHNVIQNKFVFATFTSDKFWRLYLTAFQTSVSDKMHLFLRPSVSHRVLWLFYVICGNWNITYRYNQQHCLAAFLVSEHLLKSDFNPCVINIQELVDCRNRCYGNDVKGL